MLDAGHHTAVAGCYLKMRGAGLQTEMVLRVMLGKLWGGALHSSTKPACLPEVRDYCPSFLYFLAGKSTT